MSVSNAETVIGLPLAGLIVQFRVPAVRRGAVGEVADDAIHEQPGFGQPAGAGLGSAEREDGR